MAVGTGRNLPFYPAGVSATGVELSSAMLAVARRRAAQLGMDADLVEGDAQAMPFPDASFDTMICTLSLCAIPDDHAAIGEMRRVLRPGGRLLLLDHVASHPQPLRAVQRVADLATVRLAGEHPTRRPLPLVVAAGFRLEAVERLKAGTVERIAAVRPPR